MTKAQANDILQLKSFYETETLSKVHKDMQINEMEAQCRRGRGTPHEDFLYFAGMIEGMRLMSITTLFDEAKKVLNSDE